MEVQRPEQRWYLGRLLRGNEDVRLKFHFSDRARLSSVEFSSVVEFLSWTASV